MSKELLQRTEVFQGVDMCKGESQSVVTIRINGDEVNLYGEFAAHYDMLLRDRADQAARIKTLADELRGKEKAPADEDAKGWIKHTTGKQPVADNVVVEGRCRNGEIYKDAACEMDWGIEDVPLDIVYWRIVEEKKPEKHITLSQFMWDNNPKDMSQDNLINRISEYLEREGS